MSNVITNTFINAVNNIGVPIDEIEILAHGKMNAIIRAGNKCYRIWYKDISKQLIEDKRNEYKTVKQYKDIFIVPNKMVALKNIYIGKSNMSNTIRKQHMNTLKYSLKVCYSLQRMGMYGLITNMPT